MGKGSGSQLICNAHTVFLTLCDRIQVDSSFIKIAVYRRFIGRDMTCTHTTLQNLLVPFVQYGMEKTVLGGHAKNLEIGTWQH